MLLMHGPALLLLLLLRLPPRYGCSPGVCVVQVGTRCFGATHLAHRLWAEEMGSAPGTGPYIENQQMMMHRLRSREKRDRGVKKKKRRWRKARSALAARVRRMQWIPVHG